MNCIECGEQDERGWGLKQDRCGDCYMDNPGLKRRVHCVRAPQCDWKGIRQQSSKNFEKRCPKCGDYVIMYDIVGNDDGEWFLIQMAVLAKVE